MRCEIGVRSGDHPRSRGVYGKPREIIGLPEGSSPLARGLLVRGVGGGLELGIIPARAGFTRTAPRLPLAAPDHPRSRGVYH